MHGSEVSSPSEVRLLWAAYCSSRFGKAPEATGASVHAYISDNRWVATCPECNGGMATWPEMEDACCYDCGRTFTVVFPDNLVEAVAVLEERLSQNRHWFPERESIRDLQAENAVRGLDFVPLRSRGND